MKDISQLHKDTESQKSARGYWKEEKDTFQKQNTGVSIIRFHNRDY